MINVDDWAEIRRLYFSERLGIKTISRQLGVARNTVRTAVRGFGSAELPAQRHRLFGRWRRVPDLRTVAGLSDHAGDGDCRANRLAARDHHPA
jgi:hypothetical protein